VAHLGAKRDTREGACHRRTWHAANAEEEKFPLSQFRLGLQDVGYVEGKNIILENRFPAEQPDRFEVLAAELVQINVDIMFTVTRLAALAAQRATKTIPIVFMAVADPVGSKLVDSLARPGGNITGLTNFAYDLTAKRVEFLKAVVPTVSHVALLVNPNDRDSAKTYIEESHAATNKLGLVLQPVEVRTSGDLLSAFSKTIDDQVDGVVVSQDGLFYAARKVIADLAFARKLPLAVYSRETLDAGALLSYGPSNYRIFRASGAYIDKILKGAKPADLPVEQPTKFEFIINLKTAKSIGIDVPPMLLTRADEVIE